MRPVSDGGWTPLLETLQGCTPSKRTACFFAELLFTRLQQAWSGYKEELCLLTSTILFFANHRQPRSSSVHSMLANSEDGSSQAGSV